MTLMKLLARLSAPVITPDGDLILNGTPVEVLQWEELKEGQNSTKNVLCRTIAYMYAGDIGPGGNCVGQDLVISVPFNCLVFEDFRLIPQSPSIRYT